uniref:Uncharacterized protein n=1 Tax=Nelumbo nucifera TaxID=4432 RepID=A0A822Z9B6_NELNU|nr:TPA_asm: hypothetical protein HUJ06_015486 [Nelumbo nucifera]
METPSSTRRVTTRSQTSAAMNNIPIARKNEESEKVLSRQRNGKSDRSALFDITNDSPIVGLATGSLQTPSSLAKKRNLPKQTPGSGEALLRCQVKTLLQKVEEEAEMSKLSLEHRPFLHLQSVVSSPSGLLAPTPANTPQVPNLSCNDDIKLNPNGLLASSTLSEVVDQSIVTQQSYTDMVGTTEETLESEKSLITRSLLLDFSEKSEMPDSSECSSVLTYQEGTDDCPEKSIDEDDSSVWSCQANASSIKDEDEGEDINEEDYVEEEEEENYNGEEEEEEEHYNGEEEEDGEIGSFVDELCEGLSKMNVGEKRMPEFTGKHTRFVYNSDDEIEGEEEVTETRAAASPGIVHLKGIPAPRGKHLRFPEEED